MSKKLVAATVLNLIPDLYSFLADLISWTDSPSRGVSSDAFTAFGLSPASKFFTTSHAFDLMPLIEVFLHVGLIGARKECVSASCLELDEKDDYEVEVQSSTAQQMFGFKTLVQDFFRSSYCVTNELQSELGE